MTTTIMMIYILDVILRMLSLTFCHFSPRQDVVVHVKDASHPEYELQGNTVSQTLASLPLPKETPIITVANKMDLAVTLPEDKLKGAHPVSAILGQGKRTMYGKVYIVRRLSKETIYTWTCIYIDFSGKVLLNV